MFVPAISQSQVVVNKRAAEVLSSAGHNITLIMVESFDNFDYSQVKIDKSIEVYRLNASTGISHKEAEDAQGAVTYEDAGFNDERTQKMMNIMLGMLKESCQVMIRNKPFLQWFEKKSFDLAFVHEYHACPIGIVHQAKVPTWIWFASGEIADQVAYAVGAPRIPSYIPPILMDSDDNLDFVGRLKSFIGNAISPHMFSFLIANQETSYFREEFGDDFPDLMDLAEQCPLVMCNSNDLYQIPRPTLAKIVNIGGLGADFSEAKPLPTEFATIVESAESVALFSFGSVAAAHHMPREWKTALMAAFARFPQTHFIMRYTADDLNVIKPPNVHIFKWIPQSDLLKQPKTAIFITHGGFNSMQEAIYASVPMVTIPLFGDQLRNAQVARSRNLSVSISKTNVSEQSITEAITEVLGNTRYKTYISKMSRMVRNQPISPNQLLIQYTEFLARFKKIDNFTPAGQQLHWIQYHSIDVMLCLLCVVVLVLFIIVKLLWLLLSFLRHLLSTFTKAKQA